MFLQGPASAVLPDAGCGGPCCWKPSVAPISHRYPGWSLCISADVVKMHGDPSGHTCAQLWDTYLAQFSTLVGPICLLSAVVNSLGSWQAGPPGTGNVSLTHTFPPPFLREVVEEWLLQVFSKATVSPLLPPRQSPTGNLVSNTPLPFGNPATRRW